MSFPSDVVEEIHAASKSLAESRGWTVEYAQGVVVQVIASFSPLPAPVQPAPTPTAPQPARATGQFCICDGPVHRYDPSWCKPPRFADADGRAIG